MRDGKGVQREEGRAMIHQGRESSDPFMKGQGETEVGGEGARQVAVMA